MNKNVPGLPQVLSGDLLNYFMDIILQIDACDFSRHKKQTYMYGKPSLSHNKQRTGQHNNRLVKEYGQRYFIVYIWKSEKYDTLTKMVNINQTENQAKRLTTFGVVSYLGYFFSN